VEAALDKLHDGRHAEFAAALAKELGLSADRVEKALEATRPEPPRGP
jgi:UDP-N-acetylmuramyl pentapeptide synthase